MLFQHHHQAMGGAFVQLQGRANLRQAALGRARREDFQSRQGAIENLHAVGRFACLVLWHASHNMNPIPVVKKKMNARHQKSRS
jgi:hypothetical protein